ncbi:S41 family peptidase [Parabacteroides sp. AM08-6]|uniref:S41 family peptidase n=1 Tax=Parabacteroides sp. AM08-6 TaxID=2292053 RepID=UPI000EFFA660|nr:S41 family peptidase [Parabacteroides sp. AM08-6]RHJ86575.1 hypothetical protein DW103_02610 [Parabacteroides sp. AM08-6]
MNKLCILFCILISACTHQKDVSMSLENNPVIEKGQLQSLSKSGWYVPNGLANIDSVVLYNNQKSVRLSNAPEDTAKISQIYYWVNTSSIEGKTVRFSGKYRYKGADSTHMSIGIQTMDKNKGPISTNTDIGKHSGDADWTDFTVEATMPTLTEGIAFFAYITGNNEFWLSDCQAYIDNKPLDKLTSQVFPAEKDNEFDNGSKISLPAPTPQMFENLEILGKVWGFLKYYHPAVTRGKYNWDYELFRIMPQIAQAPDKKTRNNLLNKWIDQFGKINKSAPYIIEDSSKYSRIIDLNWINNQEIFDKKLISKLNKIKDAERSLKFNYYYIPYQTGGNISRTPEKAYPSIQWKDQGFRILTLFRFWNAMEYCFPYLEMTDKPWNTLLKEFLPKFVQPENKGNYELAINELVSCINDSHGGVSTSSQDLAKTILGRRFAPNIIISTLTFSKSGDIVVEEARTTELERGDIIRSIDGEKVEKIIQDLKPFVPASNHAVLLRNTLPDLLRSDSGSMLVTCIRDGEEIELKLTNFGRNRRHKPHQYSEVKSVEEYNLKEKNIAYINVANMDGKTISDIITNNKEAKGVILDMRKYPKMDAYQTLYSLLCPTPQEFMWFAANERNAPGNYKMLPPAVFGTNNPDYFKGKVAILVNEGTQSHGEFSSMAYRKAPQSAVIGSTTAGADGNYSYISLPGKKLVTFTALGAYYPNWEICQRKGVKIDIEARPTNEEIRNGQDVWIEKAIQYISE